MWQSIIDCMALFGNIILPQEETRELLKRFSYVTNTRDKNN